LEQNRAQLTDEILSKVSPEEAFIMRYVANGPMYWCDPHFNSSALWQDHRINGDVVNHFYAVLLANYDPTASFSQITCPVFIAHGKYDFSAPPTLWEDTHEKFPNGTYQLFEHSGHYPHFEEQELFDQKLIAWIAKSAPA
jgi:proline iminopeptidase